MRFRILEKRLESYHRRMPVQVRYEAPRAYHNNFRKRGKTRLISTAVLSICGVIILFYLLAFAELVALQWVNPPTTTVQEE